MSSKNIEYIHPSVLIRLLETNLNNNLRNINDLVNYAHISATEDSIKKFLADKTEEENYKWRITLARSQGQRREKRPFPSDERNIDLEKISKIEYRFDPLILEYYKSLCVILKLRSLKILNILTCLVNKDFTSIEEEIKNLDLDIDQNGNISKRDIMRIIIPLLCNIKLLLKMTRDANNPDTYLLNREGQEFILNNGIFPIEDLQITSLSMSESPLYIPLTDNQRKTLFEKEQSSKNKVEKLVKIRKMVNNNMSNVS